MAETERGLAGRGRIGRFAAPPRDLNRQRVIENSSRTAARSPASVWARIELGARSLVAGEQGRRVHSATDRLTELKMGPATGIFRSILLKGTAAWAPPGEARQRAARPPDGVGQRKTGRAHGGWAYCHHDPDRRHPSTILPTNSLNRRQDNALLGTTRRIG